MANKHLIPVPLDLPSQQPYSAAYLDGGQGVPVLMLHGFLGDATCWQPLMERLGSDVRWVGLDLLGFGDSSKPMIRYDVAIEVAFVRLVVEALNLDPCYILGHSFGGWVAAAYALKYPNAVRGLILAAPAGIRDDSFCGRYTHLRPLLWKTPIVDWGLRLLRPFSGRRTQGLTIERLLWFRQELIANPAARSFLVDRLRPEDAIDTVEQEIHQLRLPTLVITGDQDETIPLWHSQTYANQISGARLVVLPGADHALPQKKSAELASLLLPFVQDAVPVP